MTVSSTHGLLPQYHTIKYQVTHNVHVWLHAGHAVCLGISKRYINLALIVEEAIDIPIEPQATQRVLPSVGIDIPMLPKHRVGLARAVVGEHDELPQADTFRFFTLGTCERDLDIDVLRHRLLSVLRDAKLVRRGKRKR